MTGKKIVNKNIIFLSDFDGTIGRFSPVESFNKFISGIDLSHIFDDFSKGKIGTKEAYKLLIKSIDLNIDTLNQLIDDNMYIDDSFLEYYLFLENNGIDFAVISDGYKYYIERLFEKNGMTGINIFANEIVVNDNGMVDDVFFPHADEACVNFATCKTKIIDELADKYESIFYVGDGFTDYDAAVKVDFLFARSKLKKYAAKHNISFFGFDKFSEIKKFLSEDYQWIVFDLDGVLIDSTKAILDSLNYCAESLGYDKVDSVDTISEYIGLPLDEFIEKSLNCSKDESEKGKISFREKFVDIYLDKTELLDDVKEVIKYLSGKYKLSVITNKYMEYAEELVKYLGLADFFESVYGESVEYPSKPSGELWDYFISQNSIMDKNSILYVGDSPIDYQFAKSRGIPFVALVTGFYNEKVFFELGSSFIINSINKLKVLL